MYINHPKLSQKPIFVIFEDIFNLIFSFYQSNERLLASYINFSLEQSYHFTFKIPLNKGIFKGTFIYQYKRVVISYIM